MFPKKYIFILIFFAAVLLCGKEANAATEFISTIRATGGDYSLLSTWEAAVQSGLTASTTVVYSGTGTGRITAASVLELFRGGVYQDITASTTATTTTQILVNSFSGAYKVLQDGDQWRKASSTANMWTVSIAGLGDSAIAVAKIDGAWAAAGTTAVTINGWTTSATNYIKIYTTASARHSGKWDTGKYRLEITGNSAITIFEENVRIEGLQIHVTATDIRNAFAMNPSGIADVRISHNIAYSTSSTGSGIGNTGGTANSVLRVWNNIFYDYNVGIYGNSANYTYYVYNNTVYGCGKGYSRAVGGTFIVKNNIAYNNTDNYYGAFTSSTNNLSGPTQTDAPGTNPINAAKVIFLNEANDDFHLAPNDYSSVNAGADLSVDSYLDFTDDIDGETRPVGAAWDIGADETALTKFRFDGGQMKIRGTIKFE